MIIALAANRFCASVAGHTNINILLSRPEIG